MFSPPSIPSSFAQGTISAMVQSSCRWKAGEPLICDGVLRLSGNETYRRIANIRRSLEAYGVGHGTTIALMGGSSAALAIVLFAAFELGAVCCFIHTYEREDHNTSVVNHIDARLLVVGSQEFYHEKGARIASDAGVPLGVVKADATCLEFDGAPISSGSIPRQVAADDVAMLLLSSGTTGKPKAIVHTHRSLVAMAAAGTAVYGRCGDQDSVVLSMPPSFAAWIFTMLPFLAARARVHFTEWTGAEDYLALLAREDISVAALVPTVWRMALASATDRLALPSLRVAFFSGEPGSEGLVLALAALVPEVRTAYLASEIGCACGIAGGLDTLSRHGKASSVGRPVPNADVRMVDPESERLRDVPAGSIGEILVRGASLARGYWKNDDLTAARFVDGWWRSGDLGLIDGDGHVFVKGRLDNRINSGGIKIHAEEVEAAIITHPDIAMVAVVGEPDPQWGERVVAHVVVRRPGLIASDIIEFCAASGKLSSRKVPKAVHFHEHLPMTPTNKLNRRALRTPHGGLDA